MEWDEGIGTLYGSSLKFRLNSKGDLEMVDEKDIEKVKEEWRRTNSDEKQSEEKVSNDPPEEILKCEEKIDPVDHPKESVPLSTTQKSSSSSPPTEKISDADSRKCQNCGIIGSVSKFIRAGKFCSQDCATAQSSHLRLLTKRPIILGGKDVNVKCERLQSLLKPEVKKVLSSTSEISMPHEKLVLGKGSQKRKQKVMNGSSKLSRTSSPSSTTSSLTQLAQIGGDTIVVQGKKATSNGVGGPHSPSSSEKNSRPSSPSSIFPSSIGNIQPQTALHQSIFAMRAIQHHQEPPIGWDRHSKNLTPSLEPNKVSDVIQWEPDRVAAFVNQIPGCDDMGPRFAEQVSESLVLDTFRHCFRYTFLTLHFYS